ncbi:MAG TPA: TrpB-like pyridoxal phosphate-dependent enzyme [Clostridiales bacterium]|nr:TrpB-like pyridoxal phosphate-dependent enzyme [Clostridiales bacterium]
MGEQRFAFPLPAEGLPTCWYNLAADLPFRPDPPLHPRTLQPLGPADLSALFPPSLIEQEVSGERFLDVPGEVLDVYRRWRPTPLFRAVRLERDLGTAARIYYKYEGVSPTGSHKPNTAVPQAYYNRRDGTRRLATETGAGQWGSALAFASSFFELECTVYMVRVSYEQKPYRRTLMRAHGAEVVASPSERTAAGRAVRAEHPECPGSLGIAISEAVEQAMTEGETCYALGSVLNHVLLHQTVIGLEAREQMRLAGERPDYIVGCFGGGSNFAGLAFPFLGLGDPKPTVVAAEPSACPSLTRGVYAYDYGDTAGLAPVVRMHTLGHRFVPPSIHAGGLRYHGAAPLVSAILDRGLIAARAVGQRDAFAAAARFTRCEGILPAPESAHAIKVALDLALEAGERGQAPCILFGLSGHGHFDLGAYETYLDGQLEDCEYSLRDGEHALAGLPAVPGG